MTDEWLNQPPEWKHWWNGHHPLPQLLNTRRREIVTHLAKNPGLNINELAALVSVTRTAAKWHLRRLERQQVLVKVRRGHHQLYFPSTMSPRRRDAIVMLRLGAVRSVAEHLFARPRAPLTAVADHLRLSTRQVRRIVRQLEKCHLIEILPGGAESRHVVHMHPELRLLIAHADGPMDEGTAPPAGAGPGPLPTRMDAVAHAITPSK